MTMFGMYILPKGGTPIPAPSYMNRYSVDMPGRWVEVTVTSDEHPSFLAAVPVQSLAFRFSAQPYSNGDGPWNNA